METKILQLGRRFNWFWYVVGLIALAANKVRHTFKSYDKPRPADFEGFQAAAEYDIRVFENWRAYLQDYLGRPYDFSSKTVLELGSGPDLGTGVLALAAGAGRYVAFDKFPLAAATPSDFYEYMLNHLPAWAALDAVRAVRLRQQVRNISLGKGDAVRYVSRDDFNLSAAGLGTVDLVVSQAACEHFADPRATIAQLGPLAAGGAVFLAVIDLQTHTALLRNRDPLNIYRYSEGLYNCLSFAGSPNRARPRDYIRWLVEAGWRDVRVTPLLNVGQEYLKSVRPRLADPFHSLESQMECLSIVICARR